MLNPVHLTKAFGTILLGLLALIASASPVHAQAQFHERNFTLLYHVAQLADQAYSGRSEIFGRLSNNTAKAITLSRSQVQYVLNFNHPRKIQVISVRGTANEKNVDLDLDTDPVPDSKSGIIMHKGFQLAAVEIYADLKPRLKPGYTTYLTGHSLGGSVAAILGIYLNTDRYKVGHIVTFGQPMFTDIAGAKAYRNLPLLRVIYQNDAIALLPQYFARTNRRYAHMGAVINLLSGPHYIHATAEQGMKFSVGSFRKLLGQVSVPDHKMKWYLQGLKEKRNGAKQVSIRDRHKYIIRHRGGASATTGDFKRKYNFNHHK